MFESSVGVMGKGVQYGQEVYCNGKKVMVIIVYIALHVGLKLVMGNEVIIDECKWWRVWISNGYERLKLK